MFPIIKTLLFGIISTPWRNILHLSVNNFISYCFACFLVKGYDNNRLCGDRSSCRVVRHGHSDNSYWSEIRGKFVSVGCWKWMVLIRRRDRSRFKAESGLWWQWKVGVRGEECEESFSLCLLHFTCILSNVIKVIIIQTWRCTDPIWTWCLRHKKLGP